MAGLEDYARFRVIETFRPFPRTKFREPELALFRTLVGSAVDRPLAEQIPQLLAKNLGHPASQLYVEAYCSDTTRTEVMEIGERVHAEFGKRIETREWLSEETRGEALKKTAAMEFAAGYPDAWIDFGSVEIGDDQIANILNLAAFDMDRMIERLRPPVVNDAFSTEATLPIAMNAGSSPSANRLEVSPAITQQRVYANGMDLVCPLKSGPP